MDMLVLTGLNGCPCGGGRPLSPDPLSLALAGTVEYVIRSVFTTMEMILY